MTPLKKILELEANDGEQVIHLHRSGIFLSAYNLNFNSSNVNVNNNNRNNGFVVALGWFRQPRKLIKT